MEVAEKNTLILRMKVEGLFWSCKYLPLKASVYSFLSLSQFFLRQADYSLFQFLSHAEIIKWFRSFFSVIETTSFFHRTSFVFLSAGTENEWYFVFFGSILPKTSQQSDISFNNTGEIHFQRILSK